MPKEVVAALIGISGVIVSAFVSWMVSRSQVRAETKKLRLEMQHAYLENLHRARLTAFPELYSAVEGHAKTIQRREVTLEGMKAFHGMVDKWHTNHGYLLTAATNSVMYTYLRRLMTVADSSPQSFAARLSDPEKRRQMIRSAWEVELALKNDLGIFEVEFFDPHRKFRSYRDVAEALETEDG